MKDSASDSGTDRTVIAVTAPESRTGSTRELLLAGAFFVALAYWFFGANLFAREAIGPMDLLSSAAGYSEGAVPLALTNPEKSDILDALLPMWRYVKGELRAGHLSFWDPLPSGGQPAITDLGSAFLSPRFLCFLLFPDALGYSLGLIVQLAIAALGAYLLCRRALGVLPSVLAGVTFMMCGFNAAWAQWPHVSTSCWIPWLLWALMRVLEEPSGRRIAALGAISAAMLFGGFPAVAAYGCYLAAWIAFCVVLERARAMRSMHGTLRVAAAAALGFGLALLLSAIQVLPFLEYLRQFGISHRRAQGIDLSAASYLLAPFGGGASRVESASYVGFPALLLAAFAVLLSPLKAAERPHAVELRLRYWLAAFALTFAAVYAWPGPVSRVLYKLPVLNFNPSNRMLSILGLELAVLAALGFEAFLELLRAQRQAADAGWRRILLGALPFMLIAAQCFDVARVGRAHNAVVPSSAFFPARPAIEFVRERILPGQSVIATVDAYFVPGTLGSYGIAEWYAHAYRTPAEKALLQKVVKDPWATWSAAVFGFDRIDLQSPWIDALGIRFVMTSDRKPSLVAQDRNDRPSPLLTENRIGQVIQLRSPVETCAISVVLGTYDRDYADADVRLCLRSHGKILAQSVARAEDVLNNRPAEFHFEGPLRLDPGEYDFTLESVKGATAAPISAWTLVGDDGFADGYLTINGERAVGDLRFQMLGCVYTPPPGWMIAREKNGLLILERNDSAPGAYLVDETRSTDVPVAGALEWKNVRLASYSTDRQIFEVVAQRPSLFVRTMRKWPGWRAFTDGTEVPIRPYHDVLAAVEVGTGAHKIEWRYEPRSWRRGLAGSALGASLLAALILWGNRRVRVRSTAA